MLCTYMPILYYHGNLRVTERACAGGRGFPLSQRSFLLSFVYRPIFVNLFHPRDPNFRPRSLICKIIDVSTFSIGCNGKTTELI